MLGDAREHARANLFIVVKGEDPDSRLMLQPSRRNAAKTRRAHPAREGAPLDDDVQPRS